jgi:predicted 3-demethylubiquinone-9 3-methyltransferase (glyoxalase superfamily)
MQSITPCLWFEANAEEAVAFYTSVFKDSKTTNVSYYGAGGPLPAGTVLMIEFELNGLRLQALNGGPAFKFNEAISLSVSCDDQAEVDRLWDALTADGGEESMCGWLKDKFGLSWQIVPKRLLELLQDPDPEKAQRVMQAMLQMRKIDLPALEQAYAGL